MKSLSDGSISLPHLASIMSQSQADALASAILAEIDYLQQRLNRLAAVAIQLQDLLRAQDHCRAQDRRLPDGGSTAGKAGRSLQI